MREAVIALVGRELYVTGETPGGRDSFIAKLADELLAKLIRPIPEVVPPAEGDEPIVLQLYCPDQGGWQHGSMVG